MSESAADHTSGGRFWTGPATGPIGAARDAGAAGDAGGAGDAGAGDAGAVPVPEESARLIVFTGPAGSGKSSLARAFAARHCAVYLDKDSQSGALVAALLHHAGADPEARDENEFYRGTVMPLEYSGLLSVAGDNLRLGHDVVLDAPFGGYLSDAGYLERAATNHDWPRQMVTLVVQVRISPPLRRERLQQRALARDAWKLANWSDYESVAPADCAWRGARVVDFDNSAVSVDLDALDDVIGMTAARLR